jgi:hypothetical protein
MKTLNCKRCGADVVVPDLSEAVKKNISDVAHNVGRLQAAIELKDLANLALAEGKSLSFHLTDENGHSEIHGQAEEVVCSKCRSLNLRW